MAINKLKGNNRIWQMDKILTNQLLIYKPKLYLMKNYKNKILLVQLVLYIIIFSINVYTQNCYECPGNTASGEKATAFGLGNIASGDYSFAAGYQNTAEGYSSISFGRLSNASGTYSLAFGSNCYANNLSFAFGQNARANAEQTLAIGRYVETNASGAIALGSSYSGNSLVNNIPNSLMIGFNSSKPTLFIGPTQYGQFTGKVGIGTPEPCSKLQVTDGDIYIEDINSGIIMKSPDGNCWRISIDNNGNFVSTSITCPCNSGNVPEQKNNQEINIYPNPVQNIVNIEIISQKTKTHNIEIYNIQGKLIFMKQYKTSPLSIDISDLSNGIYMLKIKDENGNIIKNDKIVKN